MRSMRFVAVILAFLVGFASCSRDPNVVKKRYLESGNKYYEKERYKEASIQYRNALKRDPKYGAAYYKLALVSLRLNEVNGAVSALRRAVELVPPDQPDHWDAVVKLSELYLAGGRSQKSLMDDVRKYIKDLFKHDPNSPDAYRLEGDLNYASAIDAYGNKRVEEGKALLAAATEAYRKSDSIKPGQQGVSMQLARVMAAGGDYAASEALYRAVIEKDKSFQNGYSELYRVLMVQKKPAEAEQILKSAVERNPKVYDFLIALAGHYWSQRRPQEMVAALNQVKTHFKEFDRAYATVGDFYLRTGDGDSAIREYREGIANDAAKKSVYQKRIIEVLMRQGKRREAAELNSQILKDTPGDTDSRGLAATFLLDQGDISKAMAELQAVVTAVPANPVARYNLGRAHALRGEAEQARQQFQKAIELQPSHLQARLELAKLQASRLEFDAAFKSAEAILAFDPGNASARLIQSLALMGQKKYGESRAILDAMLKANPGSADVLFQLGLLNLSEKKFKEAEDAYRRSYQLNPANSRGLLGVVEANLLQNKPDNALKLLQAESDKAPTRVDLLFALGSTAARTGRLDMAQQNFERAIAQTEKGALKGELYLRLGEVYRRKGESDRAVQALQKARETLPDNVTLLSTLALILDRSERKAEARQVYEATLKIDPNNAVALNNLAFLLAETGGDLDDALKKATRAQQLLPRYFEVNDTVGWIYLKKNMTDNAIDVFERLVAKEPNQATYRYHLGMAYQKKGDKSKALDQLREALKFNPAKEEKEKIQQLIATLG